jgi:uncharacterized protein
MSAREIAWHLGAPARSLLLVSISLYRTVLSGWLGGQCRFYPSCSHYAEQAIRELGAVKGVSLTVWRVARCNPYGRGGIDLVPSRTASSVPYDGIPHSRREAHT